MLELLRTYDVSEILIFMVLLGLAIKGGWDLIDYFKKKYNEKFNKDYNKKKAEDLLNEHYVKCSNQYAESTHRSEKLETKIDDLSTNINNKFKNIDKRFDNLEKSDMHQIKHNIVKDYHYFVEGKGWIDDFNLNCLELIYEDYTREGGNSYVEGLMKELRALPKHPPLN